MPERFTPSQRNEWRQFGHQHLQRYRFALERIEGTRVLDMACGVGYGSYFLAQGLGREVTGIDLDEQAIEYGKLHYRRTGLRLVTADALRWKNDGAPFDTIVSFETIEHLPDPPSFVARVADLIKPGGRLVISAPNVLQHQRAAEPIVNPYHLNEPDYATLCSWLNPYFSIEAEWEQSTVLAPGVESLPTLRYDVEDLQRCLLLRVANRLESLFRSRSPRRTAQAGSAPLIAFTEILPLLPERREDCEVFLFVCRRV